MITHRVSVVTHIFDFFFSCTAKMGCVNARFHYFKEGNERMQYNGLLSTWYFGMTISAHNFLDDLRLCEAFDRDFWLTRLLVSASNSSVIGRCLSLMYESNATAFCQYVIPRCETAFPGSLREFYSFTDWDQLNPVLHQGTIVPDAILDFATERELNIVYNHKTPLQYAVLANANMGSRLTLDPKRLFDTRKINLIVELPWFVAWYNTRLSRDRLEPMFKLYSEHVQLYNSRHAAAIESVMDMISPDTRIPQIIHIIHIYGQLSMFEQKTCK